MMNRKNRCFAGCSLLAVPAVVLGLTACSDSSSQQQTQDRKPPPPPPPPVVETAPPVEELMAQLNVDPRIHMDENEAPRSESARRAVLQFVDAFLQDSPQMLRDKISMDDQLQLDRLIEENRWINPEEIDDVMVFAGENPNKTGMMSSPANLAVLAVFFTVDGRMEPTMWYMEEDRFVSAVTPVDILDRMSGDDLINAWHAVVDEERAKGRQMDIDIRLPQQILEQRRGGGGVPGQPNEPQQPTPPNLPNPGGPNPGSPGTPGGPSGPGVPL